MTGVRPRIALTLARPSAFHGASHQRYRDALEGAGAELVVLHPGDPVPSDIDGLCLSGGGDIEAARYGEADVACADVDTERDALEIAIAKAAIERDLPVLGICRGFQVINVFMGGSLLQDVGGHRKDLGTGPPVHHPLRIAPGTRLARILFPRNVGGGVLSVNSFHHQGVRAADLAPGLLASAWAASPTGDLVEGVEASDTSRFLVGLQCHPERIDSTPPEFERLWSVFVDACRGSARGRAAGRTAEAASTGGRPG
jgi:putative glutamine amidotransferase